jgi:hypothetical protein
MPNLKQILGANLMLRLAEKQEEEQRVKRQKKKEIAQRREDKAAAQRQQRAAHDPNEPFRGSLTSKNKGDLQEIAGVLGLSEDGTMKDLQARIAAHFDAHSDLRESPLFTGLFNRTRTSQPNKANDTSTHAQPMLLQQHHSPLTTNILNIMQPQPGPSNYHHNPYLTSAQHSHLYYYPPSIPSTCPSNPRQLQHITKMSFMSRFINVTMCI